MSLDISPTCQRLWLSNTIAECLRTDRNVLGDLKKKYRLFRGLYDRRTSRSRTSTCKRAYTGIAPPPTHTHTQEMKRAVADEIASINQELLGKFYFIFFLQFCESFNPLNPELNPICYLLALLIHHFLHVSRIRVKSLTLRLLMS